MDYLRINSSKLKITLTSEDCERYGIRETDGEFDSKPVREVIADILEEAGAGSFCKPREKLLVQLYPMRGGGAELFITKLAHVGEREQRAIDSSASLSTYERASAVFLFDKLDDLLRASRLPSLSNKRADLYLRHDGKYLLCATEERMGGLSDLDVLSEFAVRLGSVQSSVRPEWDKQLARGDAIQRLKIL